MRYGAFHPCQQRSEMVVSFLAKRGDEKNTRPPFAQSAVSLQRGAVSRLCCGSGVGLVWAHQRRVSRGEIPPGDHAFGYALHDPYSLIAGYSSKACLSRPSPNRRTSHVHTRLPMFALQRWRKKGVVSEVRDLKTLLYKTNNAMRLERFLFNPIQKSQIQTNNRWNHIVRNQRHNLVTRSKRANLKLYSLYSPLEHTDDSPNKAEG